MNLRERQATAEGRGEAFGWLPGTTPPPPPPAGSKQTHSEGLCFQPTSGHRLNSWQLLGLLRAPVAFTGEGRCPVQLGAAQKVRVSPSESPAGAQVSLHYFFRFSFLSFLFFISLFFFNFLFCLGSCLASTFLFLSLFRLTMEAFCPALFKTSFHSSSSPRIMY